jgi:hypothetical protein
MALSPAMIDRARTVGFGLVVAAPRPSLRSMGARAERFAQVAASGAVSAEDAWLLEWAFNAVDLARNVLAKAGRALGRRRFVEVIESGDALAAGLLPPQRFGPNRRFGGDAVFLFGQAR